MVTFAPTCTISEVLRFSWMREMTSCQFLREGALWTVFDDRFWKIDTNFLSVVNGSFCSNTHHFRDIEVFLDAGNDVTAVSPLGAPYTVFDGGFWKIDTNFLSVVNSNYCSKTHHFRDIEIFLVAGNDVIAVSPLGDAVYSFRWWILKDRHQLPICGRW